MEIFMALYSNFKDAPFPAELVVPASALALVSVVGIPLNLSVIYVTAKAS
jgi:hypothetical protein